MTQSVAERIAEIEADQFIVRSSVTWLITELRAALARVEAVEGIASGLRERINVALDRAEATEAVLGRVKRLAKEHRNSAKLTGPSEYHRDRRLMKVWEKTRYHTGKDLDEIIKDCGLEAAKEP